MKPVLLVVAGPNGAGKTTVTVRLREERWSEGVEYLAFETVLSTASKLDFIARAKDRGYFIRVFFIGTSDPRINAARVAGRVMEGGHTVPIEKIVSRYVRSMGNLGATIRLADRVYVYDNSEDGVEARLCFRTQDSQLRKIYGPLPGWVSDVAQSLARHREYVDLRVA